MDDIKVGDKVRVVMPHSEKQTEIGAIESIRDGLWEKWVLIRWPNGITGEYRIDELIRSRLRNMGQHDIRRDDD